MDAFDARVVAHCLTGSMGLQAFDETLREQRSAKFDAAIDPEQVWQLFSLARLESLFAAEAIPFSYVDIFEHGHAKRLADMQWKSGRTGLAVMAERFRAGATLRVRDVDRFDVRLNQFVAEIREYFVAESQINLYLTPPAMSGFDPHFDTTDVFVVQCLGLKQWRVYEEYANRIHLPLMETPWDPDRFRPSSTPPAMTLSEGDVLYLPRGTMHDTFCSDRESMHLTISVMPLTFVDVISRELARVAAEDIRFRRRVVWSVDTEDNDGIEERITAEVRERLAELSERVALGALLRAARQSLRHPRPESGSASDLSTAIASLLDTRASGQASSTVAPS